jgi:1,4-alpha-glucan branching enzyme
MTKRRTAVAAPPRSKQHTILLNAPGAKSVAVTGSFCGWSPEGHPLCHDTDGIWKATLTLRPGRYEYRFLVDGQWWDDPTCDERVPNPFGSQNCVFEV